MQEQKVEGFGRPSIANLGAGMPGQARRAYLAAAVERYPRRAGRERRGWWRRRRALGTVRLADQDL